MDTVGHADPQAGSRSFTSQILEDGFFCGVIGAGVVALWYLVLDTIAGHPLYTPSLLGSLLFQKGASLSNVTVQPAIVAWYTAVHTVAFLIVGVIASWMAAHFERFPTVGIAMLFLFVIFETAFFIFALAVGKHVLPARPVDDRGGEPARGRRDGGLPVVEAPVRRAQHAAHLDGAGVEARLRLTEPG
jgi:hypothetical protein